MQLYKMLLKFNFAHDNYNSCSAMNSSMQRIAKCLVCCLFSMITCCVWDSIEAFYLGYFCCKIHNSMHGLVTEEKTEGL